MTNLDSILKSRDITLPTKVRLVKAMIFPVVMFGCESWTIKKAERRRIDAFELWCWRRCLRVPWTARRSKQSILKEISPGCSLEGLMLKLKLQYFGHLMWRADSFEKTLMLGKTKGGRRRGRQRMRWLDGITDSMDMGGLACCGSQGHKESDMTEWPNWTEDMQVPLYATTLKAASKEELMRLSIREKGEKAGLKLNIKTLKIMASSPITLWQIDGGKVETVTDFILLGSKIIADCNCSHEWNDACSFKGKLWQT